MIGKREEQTSSKSMTTIIPSTRTPARRPRSALRVILIASAPSFFAVALRIQAVSPAPDGGYPGGNTAEGQNALLSLTTGTYNTAVGFLSLRSDTSGNFNTGAGAGRSFSMPVTKHGDRRW